MIKLTKFECVLAGLVVVISGVVFTLSSATTKAKANSPNRKNANEKVDVVTVGVPGGSFAQSYKEAGVFYGHFRKAETERAAGNFELAIAELQKSLEYVALRAERAMVYRELAGIYKTIGDDKREIESLEQEKKWTLNEESKKDIDRRLVGLRSKLSSQKTGE